MPHVPSELKRSRTVAGVLGLSALAVLLVALIVFSWLNPSFHLLEDYVSKLGAMGQPHALWWNVVGFGTVGFLLAGFGLTYGRVLGDRPVSLLLVIFGIGFSATGIPVELGSDSAPLSKAHVVAICVGLAAYMFALARIGHLPTFATPVRRSANTAATLLGIVIAGQLLQLWSMPVTHRLVFLVVFGWVAIISLRLLIADPVPRAATDG